MLRATCKVTGRGRLRILADVQWDQGLRAGAERVWDPMEEGESVQRADRFTLDDLPRFAGPASRHLTDDELRDARHAFLDARMMRLESEDG